MNDLAQVINWNMKKIKQKKMNDNSQVALEKLEVSTIYSTHRISHHIWNTRVIIECK